MAVFAASVIGQSHRRQGRSGQDAWASATSAAAAGRAALTVAVVTDGCSAGRSSEVGAGVGARAALASALRHRRSGAALVDLPALVVADVVAEVGRLARVMGAEPNDAGRVIEEALLFTLHVAVIEGDQGVVFGVGDGVISIDGQARAIDQGDAPDYPAYALFPDLAPPRVLVHHLGRFASSIAICSDGARELIERAHEPLADGTALGGLAGFEREQRFLRNHSLAQKRLHSWCSSTGGPIDDCTLVVIRGEA